MDNPVVVRAVEVCAEVNVATLRFNFRGVGASGGAHGRGVAEEEDVRAAVATLAATLGAPVATAAYLFGAAMVARLACVGDPLAGLLLVAPPLGRYDFDCLARTQVAPLALIAGTRDPLCPADSLRSLAARLPGARTRLVEGADHYFFGKLYPLGEAIADWARDLVAPGNSAGGGGAR